MFLYGSEIIIYDEIDNQEANFKEGLDNGMQAADEECLLKRLNISKSLLFHSP